MPALCNDQRGCNLTVAREDMCGVPNVYLDAMLADDFAERLDLECVNIVQVVMYLPIENGLIG